MVGARGIEVGKRGGGIERHVAELSRRLVVLGHDVTVFCRGERGEARVQNIDGIRLRAVPTLYLKWLETAVHSVLSVFAAAREEHDVIHLHGIGPGALAPLARRLAPKATIVVTFHGQDQFHGKWGPFVRAALRFAERIAITSPDYCISVSHLMQVYAREHFGVEVVYIPNGAVIKDAPDDTALARFGIAHRKYILAVARLVPQKGLHELIEAYKELSPDVHLVIAGAASDTDAYAASLMKLADGDRRIHFVGYQEGAVLDALYAHARLFVHPSHAEGLSVAVLEAMSFGTPVLVADIPANLEAIHDAGLRFPVGDVAALRATMTDLLAQADKTVAMGEKGRAAIAEHCTWEKAAQRTAAVYVTARH